MVTHLSRIDSLRPVSAHRAAQSAYPTKSLGHGVRLRYLVNLRPSTFQVIL